MNLRGKTALITGASRGIGRACALKLAESGADIAVNYSSNKVLAEEVVRMIRQMGRQAVAVQADVSRQKEAEAMVETAIDALGGLDILINNAGITRDALLIRMKEEDWVEVLNTNLSSVFFTTKAAVKYMMKKRRGRIINISSVIGMTGNAGQANYSASKAGIVGFSKSIARELAQRNILVNVIAPGFIETDMTNILSEKQKDAILSMIPLGRYGKPEDIANLAAFLASDESGYLTGQVIPVDGGMNM
ncbi:MAG: 3-oxoacyl-[acyl-carrier-protein] reductase [Caldicoprobacterales bacterium]|jgi:3-oxoacyl-[acyl-carrier protein] reductase|nr:3-oxoacyl-[acyl-carrier-protein] reductase [Clostridiales bacterium]